MSSPSWGSQILTLFEPFIPILLLASPAIYTTWEAFSKRPSVSQTSAAPTRYYNVILALVAIHATVLIYNLLLDPPFNVFVQFGLPIDVSPDTLHKALLSEDSIRASSMYASPSILFNKLRHSMENRILYARFGHGVFSSGWAKTMDEYLLTTMTPVLWSYLLQLGVMNAVMVIGDQGKWRKVGTWIEGVMFILEAYTRFAFHLGDGKSDVLQLDHRLFQLRTILHLLLTLSLLYLPKTTLPTPLTASLPALLQHLHTARSATSFTTLARKSTTRNSTLGAKVMEKGERDESIARAARNDQGVREASRNFGWMEDDRAEGVQEELVRGGLREKARRDVEVGWELMNVLSESRRRRIREMIG